MFVTRWGVTAVASRRRELVPLEDMATRSECKGGGVRKAKKWLQNSHKIDTGNVERGSLLSNKREQEVPKCN